MHSAPSNGIRGRLSYKANASFSYAGVTAATTTATSTSPNMTHTTTSTTSFIPRPIRPRPPAPSTITSSSSAAASVALLAADRLLPPPDAPAHDSPANESPALSAVKKPSRHALSFSRLQPNSAVLALLALAFVVFAAVVARNIGSFVVPVPAQQQLQPPLQQHAPSTLQSLPQTAPQDKQQFHPPSPPQPPQQQQQQQKQQQQQQQQQQQPANPATLSASLAGAEGGAEVDPSAGDGIPANVDTEDDPSDVDTSLNPRHGVQSGDAAASAGASSERSAPSGATDNGAAMGPNLLPVSAGAVSWNRSWPMTSLDDTTSLYRLAAALRFSNNTMLNYFHLHKTGGVTTKSQLREFTQRMENQKLLTRRNQPMRSIETCYRAVSPLTKLSVRVVNWRCDFRQIRELPAQELRSIDIVMGHQYWNRGCDFYFGAMREIRYFSIFRHPLPRKLSFYHHFFVRNLERDENSVPRDEILKFVLADDLPNDPRMRDAGPNYFTSRMLSDGMSGFRKNLFPVDRTQQDAVLDDVLQRLEERFVFTGLQLQNDASQCMIEKTMQVLAHAHGIDNMVGTPKLGESKRRLNSGKYRWTAQKLWASMTAEQRAKFNEVEKMDLAIYRKAVEKFKTDVKMFACEHKVVEEHWAEDTFG